MLEKQQPGDDAQKRKQLRLPALKPGQFHRLILLRPGSDLMKPRALRQVSGVFLGALCGVRRIFRQQSARSQDHFDPVRKSVCQYRDEILEGAFLEASAFIETVVRHMAEIGLRLLHHWHIEEYGGLTDLVVRAKPADAPG